MSKEAWFRSYERALDAGLSEEDAIEAAEDAASEYEARKVDEAMERLKYGDSDR